MRYNLKNNFCGKNYKKRFDVFVLKSDNRLTNYGKAKRKFINLRSDACGVGDRAKDSRLHQYVRGVTGMQKEKKLYSPLFLGIIILLVLVAIIVIRITQ